MLPAENIAIPPNGASDFVVYVIGQPSGGPVKIGFTNNLQRRLSELSVGSPLNLEVIVSMPGDEVYERSLHARFASARKRGEWFERTEELWAWVQEAMTEEFQKRRAEECRIGRPGTGSRPWRRVTDQELTRLSALTHLARSTVRRWACGENVTTANANALRRAAGRLGIPMPEVKRS